MRRRDDLVHVGLTAVVVGVAVLLDAAMGGWATVSWRPVAAIVLISGLVWVGRRGWSPGSTSKRG